MTSFFTKKQRLEVTARYLDAYTDWYNDEPQVYDRPEDRAEELAYMSNSELYELIKSDCPSLLN